jgi:Na+-driven multidrug efflux pump
LPPAQYGAFGVVLETILFLNSLQAALIIYPMTVAGAAGDARTLRKLVGGAILFTLLLLPLLGGLAGAATFTSNRWPVVFCAVFALLTWQLQETTRRALLADMRIKSMIWGDSTNYLGQAAIVFILARANALTVGNALLAMGSTSLIGAGIQALQLNVRLATKQELRVQSREFWRLGKWALLSNVGAVVTSLGYLWTLRISHGLEAVAAYAAMVALCKPLNPISASLCGIITPSVARVTAARGPKASIPVAVKYLLLGGMIVAPPYALMFFMPATILRLLYGPTSQYVAVAGFLRLALVAYCLLHFTFVLNAWLSGLGESRASFLAQSATIATATFVAIPLTAILGVQGLVWGALFATAVGAATAALIVFRTLRRRIAEQDQDWHSPSNAHAVSFANQPEHAMTPG